MDTARQHLLRDEMRKFVTRNDVVAYTAILIDFSGYLGATVLAVVLEPIWQKLICSLVAGTMTSSLFVLGHDATHGSLVSKPWQNRVLGRVLFFPALHNYTLWRMQHNRLHHQMPNVRGYNSWWPLSVAEFSNLPAWRQTLERIYRGGGFGLYYLVERWWKDKILPIGKVDPDLRARAWIDVVFLAVWLTGLIASIILLGSVSGRASPISAVFWGFVLPYGVWNCLMGLTTYLQHTNPSSHWFRTQEDAEAYGGQERRTIHVRFPRWYGLLGHEIMDHPAHHINPLIPYYRLREANARLLELIGDDAIADSIGPRYLRSVMRRCKLYDYDRREWLDFSGRTSRQTETQTIVPGPAA